MGSMITNDPRYDADVKALKGYEDVTTTAAMGKIAQDANGGKPTVAIHAGDKSYDEVVAEQKTPTRTDAAELALQAIDGLEIVGALETGPGAAIILPAMGLRYGIHHLIEANAQGAERGVALARDEQHVAMLTNLALPDGFKNGELAKYSHAGKTFEAGNQKMTTAIAGADHALMAPFKAGFDAMKWAHTQGGDTYKSLVGEVNGRDAKYGAAGVSWRV